MLTPSPTTADLELAARVLTHALVRAEMAERLPTRLSSRGGEIWKAFRNELKSNDLLSLVIRDVAVTHPIPFAVEQIMPGATSNALFQVTAQDVREWTKQALEQADLSSYDFLRTMAAMLQVAHPRATEGLPLVQPHQQVLELPGTGGWLAYRMVAQKGAQLYFWENFSVIGSRWQEVVLAGIIGWELGAPPRYPLRVYHDPTMVGANSAPTLEQLQRSFDYVVGLRAHHAQLELGPFLRENGKVILL